MLDIKNEGPGKFLVGTENLEKQLMKQLKESYLKKLGAKKLI
jgi:hypothetical protein